MVTFNEVEELNKHCMKCVSTDTKPTENVATNSVILELDTGDYYYFDGTAWQLTSSSMAGEYLKITPQTLTDAQKSQALENLGVDAFHDDAYYPELSVGNADQLKSNIYEEDKVPFNFRTSGGTLEIGDREEMEVVGGSLAVNQHAKELTDDNYTETNCSATYSDGVATMTASATNGTISQPIDFIEGHKYFVGCQVKLTTGTTLVSLNTYKTGLPYDSKDIATTSTTSWQTLSAIRTASYSTEYFVRVIDRRTSDWDAIQIKNVMLIDLTQMLGSAIADRLYTLESGNTGDGVSALYKLLPILNGGYVPYNVGTMQSVKTSEFATTGFNQWDEEWESGYYDTTTGAKTPSGSYIRSTNFIRVFPNTEYYYNNGTNTIILLYFDINKNFIGVSYPNNNTRTTPSNCYYITINITGTTYNHDICINLHWDGERDGEYEAYVKHTYPLENTELRGLFKLDANNNIYCDGDVYESGKITRKYGIVDLGTLTWTKYTHATFGDYFYANILTSQPSTSQQMVSTGQNIICSKYVDTLRTQASFVDKSMVLDNGGGYGQLQIKDSDYSDADTFKTAMSGVYLVYELKTPTEETALEYTVPQIVNNWGTEEYVDTRAFPVPVGHNTKYLANLKAKLESAPDLPQNDGEYVLEMSSGLASYKGTTNYVKNTNIANASDGDMIVADGSGGIKKGSHKYIHDIAIETVSTDNTTAIARFSIITNSATPLTTYADMLNEFSTNYGSTADNDVFARKCIPAFGAFYMEGSTVLKNALAVYPAYTYITFSKSATELTRESNLTSGNTTAVYDTVKTI